MTLINRQAAGGKETDVVYISLSMVELRRPWFDYLSQIIKLEKKKKKPLHLTKLEWLTGKIN